MSEHDVIVVGAGPAGSAAAANLAGRGLDVLLLDRKDFPRDKTCGDGVPPGSVQILHALGMGEALRKAAFYPVHGIRLGSPWGRTWETQFESKNANVPFVIAPRRQFDALIRDHAVARGAGFQVASVRGIVRDGDRVAGVRATVDGADRELRARAVVGADGATSVVARALLGGKAPLRSRGVAIRCYVEGMRTLPHKVEFYFQREFCPGYGWVFPLGSDRANVGVIVPAARVQKAGKSLEELLSGFLEGPTVHHRLGPGWQRRDTASWQLTYDGTWNTRRVFDGALLIGDAGRFVDSLTGEGIHNALVSSQAAADVLAAALLGRGVATAAALEPYEARCRREIEPLLRRSYRLQRWVASVPPVLETLFLVARLGGNRVQDLLNRVSTDFVVHA